MNNLELMRKRLGYQGGVQDERMIKDKYRTFLRALKYSYQACDVSMAQPHDICLGLNQLIYDKEYPKYRALINPDKTKQDYDDKILSIDYSTGFNPGDIFNWIGTNTYWIIYLQQLTEDAYFRGEIRQCRYQIKFRNDDGETFSTWAAIRGPVETQINSIQKNQIRLDEPNLSLNILLPRNEYTLSAFDRYKEFLFAGKCWRVEAPDSISMKNIIEVNAEEYYIDKDTDDIEEELKNGLVIEPLNPTPETDIIGETFINAKIEEIYSSPIKGGKWCIVEKNMPVKITLIDDQTIKLVWDKTIAGRFTLQWEKDDYITRKIIVVESLM